MHVCYPSTPRIGDGGTSGPQLRADFKDDRHAICLLPWDSGLHDGGGPVSCRHRGTSKQTVVHQTGHYFFFRGIYYGGGPTTEFDVGARIGLVALYIDSSLCPRNHTGVS
jgi:hypothetical protein